MLEAASEAPEVVVAVAMQMNILPSRGRFAYWAMSNKCDVLRC